MLNNLTLSVTMVVVSCSGRQQGNADCRYKVIGGMSYNSMKSPHSLESSAGPRDYQLLSLSWHGRGNSKEQSSRNPCRNLCRAWVNSLCNDYYFCFRTPQLLGYMGPSKVFVHMTVPQTISRTYCAIKT